MIGRTIGHYRIESHLGSGGMGAVYRGLDTMLERPVAIKVLRSDVARQPHVVERFKQEARTLARLLHPNIATLYALVPDGGDLCMVMEFCEGETFEALLARRGRLDPAEVLPLFKQALDGIGHAHAHGIVHRDVKPANLIRTPDGTVKVMDFGIARLLGSSRMTQTHHTVGTAEYMAPEQVRAQDVDGRSDVYALGVLLYELLTGRVPFQSDSFFEVMQAHLTEAPPPMRPFAPTLPEPLIAVVLRAMEKAPADRFASASDLHAALDAAVRPSLLRPAAARPTTLVPAPEARDAPGGRGGGAEAPAPRPDEPPKPNAPDVNAPDPVRAAAAAPATRLAPTPEPSAPTRTPRKTRLASRRGSSPKVAAATALAPTPAPTAPDTDPPTVPFPTRVAPVRAPAGSATPTSDPGPEPPAAPPAWWTQTPARIGAGVAAAVLLAVGAWVVAPGPESAATTDTEAVTGSDQPRPAGGHLVAPLDGTMALGPLAIPTPGTPGASDAPAPGEAPAAGAAPPPAAAAPPTAAAVRGDAPVASNPAPAPTRERAPEPIRESRPAPSEIRSEVAATGVVRVLVRPFGDVYVDGQRLASGTNAPVTTEVAPGAHTVRVTHPVFGTQERSVRVEAGRTAEVFIEFATPATVTVTSDPVNAQVYLDGQATGRYTPATVQIPPGTHTVEVRLDGYGSSSRQVTVGGDRSPGTLRFSLTRN